MYTHILVPTDGSKLSAKAVAAAVRLARQCNARVTALHCSPSFEESQSEGVGYGVAIRKRQHDAVVKERADEALAAVESAAQKADVPCQTLRVVSDQPWKAIIRAVGAKGCDLIVMAAHGRRGLQGLLVGSETHKVLTHSETPVLVYR